MNAKSLSPTRLSRYNGKLYDKETGAYLGRIERTEPLLPRKGDGRIMPCVVWEAFEPGGKKHELASLKDARWVLWRLGQKT